MTALAIPTIAAPRPGLLPAIHAIALPASSSMARRSHQSVWVYELSGGAIEWQAVLARDDAEALAEALSVPGAHTILGMSEAECRATSAAIFTAIRAFELCEEMAGPVEGIHP